MSARKNGSDILTNKLPLLLNLAGIGCLLVFGAAKLHQAVAGESALEQVNARLAAMQTPLDVEAQASVSETSTQLEAGAQRTSQPESQSKAAGSAMTPSAPALSSQTRSVLAQSAPPPVKAPDMTDWSAARKKGYAEQSPSAETSLAMPPALIGKIRIDDIDVEAALFDGDSELNLNKGVARVSHTAGLGEQGNLVIAGHRDSFFRKLGQLKKGASIDVMSVDGQLHRYQMTDSWIVTPEDTWVMAPVSSDVLTLITCYPFYFVGSAPQRYIVRAKKVSPHQQ
ncbi:class D sortase [Shewanella khirikhana]|uniref:Sortase family protein n=1 Tax=Shewanella khirikhana TaxID=1965282 RepID=A0ABM7DAL8_9GAMM|nr:class D sortase [Shewanella khirikhana]AZQ10554.1 Sortase family protein [Shewanella khirikhana]